MREPTKQHDTQPDEQPIVTDEELQGLTRVEVIALLIARGVLTLRSREVL